MSTNNKFSGLPKIIFIPKNNRHDLNYLKEIHDDSNFCTLIREQERNYDTNEWQTCENHNSHVMVFKFRERKDFLITTISGLRDSHNAPVDNIINAKSRIWKMITRQGNTLHVSSRLTNTRFSRSEFSNKIIKKLFQYSIEGWVGLRDRNNDFIIMRICCSKCKTIWDQEEKECLFCKTWHAPLFICSNCGDGVSDESKRACPRCNARGNPNRRIVPRGNDRCMKCGREYTSNGGHDKTYFVPITFCQACGNRENCFEFMDLK